MIYDIILPQCSVQQSALLNAAFLQALKSVKVLNPGLLVYFRILMTRDLKQLTVKNAHVLVRKCAI